MSTKRDCKIVHAELVTEDGGGDGAYDLHDKRGTPEEVGKAIADCLATADILRGSRGSWLLNERGEELYLHLRIRVKKAE